MLPDTYVNNTRSGPQTLRANDNFFKTSVSFDSLGDRSMSLLLKVYRLIFNAVSTPMYGWDEAERLGWNLPG